MNFLEQLVSEWYEYQGYFVRTNIKFGKRQNGGYEGEMDVVAFNLKEKTLIHFETSGDAGSWVQRRGKLKKKFQNAAKYYGSIFDSEFDKDKKNSTCQLHKTEKSNQT